MKKDKNKISINIDYPQFQLAKVFRQAMDKSHQNDSETAHRIEEKFNKWQQVISGIMAGTIKIGSRTPVNAPAWVTLEVLTGGFATGNFLAGGQLQDHELKLLERLNLNHQNSEARKLLNTYFLTDQGFEELKQQYISGHYRINIPEEGALLAVVSLLSQNKLDQAIEIIETILPYLDTLRFYPIPSDDPITSKEHFFIQTVAETIESLAKIKTSENVLKQKETITVWKPLYREFFDHFIKSIEGPLPQVERDAEGNMKRDGSGSFILNTYHPMRYHFSREWKKKLKQLLLKFEDACQKHRLCRRPYKHNSSLYQITFLAKELKKRNFKLSHSLISQLSLMIGRRIGKQKYQDPQKRQKYLEAQQAQIEGLVYEEYARLLIERLKVAKQTEGLEDLTPYSEALSKDEVLQFQAKKAYEIPNYFRKKIKRCLSASLDTLIEENIITSADTLAKLLPQITAAIQGKGFIDLNQGRLYEALYQAFRKRRSLLLLNLESQVSIEEIPWLQKLKSEAGGRINTKEVARQALNEISEQVICSFPQAIIPNKLLQEMIALLKTAEIDLPIVNEIAADIFMGKFSDKFLKAAAIAGQFLKGTLYERYYDIDYNEIISISKRLAPSRVSFLPKFFQTSSNRSFRDICFQRANVTKDTWSAASNGQVIEQQQILTTQNLAVLILKLNLQEKLKNHFPILARHCFQWICQRQQMKVDYWHGQLIMVKNTAYAWRQMIIYISFMDSNQVPSLIQWMQEHLQKQNPEFRMRFNPAMAGLEKAIKGIPIEPPGRIFLGWTTEEHWLLSKKDDTKFHER